MTARKKTGVKPAPDTNQGEPTVTKPHLKLCVLNFSGNVGKTTIAAHMLQSRLGAPLISVETLNQDAENDGVDVERLRAARYGDLLHRLFDLDSAIVDVGSSNVETFMALMAQYGGSHREFDFFIVPTVKESKQIADTINTILALVSLGIETERIKVVFNKVDQTDDVRDDFRALWGMDAQGLVRLNERATIQRNEVFDRLKRTQRTLAEIVNDSSDFRQARREAKTPESRQAASELVAIKWLSETCVQNLDAVYKELFAEAA